MYEVFHIGVYHWPAFNLADSAVFIGAVSLGTVIFNFIYWGFSFLRMGTSGFTAQAYGEKNEGESFHILSRAMLISTLISVVIIMLQFPIEWISFKLINGSQEVELLAREYFRIRIWTPTRIFSC